MFHLNLKEYRAPGVRLADYLPWALLVDEGIIQTKTGALMRTLRYRGHDLQSRSPEEHVAVHAQLNRALQSLGSGWALHVEARRVRCDEYIRPSTGPAIARVIDHVRFDNFVGLGALFATEYYLTVTWTPEGGASKKLVERILSIFGGLFDGGEEVAQEQRQREEALAMFRRTTRQLIDRCQALFCQARWLGDDELLTYVHSTISTNTHPISAPSVPMYLDAVLADQAAEVGVEGRLGPHHFRVVSVKGYPDRTHPSFLRALESCDFELRFVTRFLALSHEEATRELSKYENLLFSQQDKLVSSFLNKGGDSPKNAAAVEAAQEVGGVLKRVEQGHISAGYHSASVMVWDVDYDVCQQRAEHVMALLRQLGFACTDESGNLKAAWLGTHPANVWANPRRALVSSMNLAHMLPTQATWTGCPRSTHLGQAPHVYATGRAGVPFRLNLNLGDVGHTMILGPSGSGKSVLLGLLELQWTKYEDAQVFIFDKGRSSRAATLAAGGQFLELSVDMPEVTFQPLRDVDDPAEAEWVQGWCEEICALEGVTMDARRRSLLHTALESVRAAPRHLRTMTTLCLALQSKELRQVFAPYASGANGPGPYAPLWDHDSERLGLGAWTAIEMGQLMESTPRLIAMTLQYLFHRLEQRFDGSPTLLVLDEAWVFLSDPMFADRLAQWLRELRKYKVYVIFATQNITDALEGPIAATLLQNCPTQILLPNQKATTPAVRSAYERLGLGAAKIDQIAQAQPKREYLFCNPEGTRLFELGLSPLELALVGASAPEDHAVIDAALADAAKSDTSRSFAYHYLVRRGFRRYAEQMP